MAYEMLVGLQISDDNMYTQYRQAMTPILLRFGGGFRYDFKISEVLKNEEGNPINRVFIIYFSDESSKNQFFSDPEYKVVKEKYYDKSVSARTMIAEYIRPVIQ